MQAKLYQKLREKKEILKEFIDSSLDKTLSDKKIITEKWNDYTPFQKNNFSVLVSDGSFMQRPYLGFYLMVFGGYGYFYDFTTKDKADFSVGDIIISVAKRDEFAKSYISLLMFLAEVKAMWRLAKEKKPDFIIFDGTITSRLITPFPRSEWFTKSDKQFEDLINSICLEIVDENKDKFLESEDIFSIQSEIRKIISEKLKGRNINRYDFIEAITAKLSYYEMMLIIKELLELKESVVMGLAKTSSGTDIFGESLPDIKLFSKYIDKLGFSIYFKQDISKLKSSFGEIISDISDFLSKLDIVSFYSKYSNIRYINLIEIYQNPERKTNTEGFIKEVLDMLHSISIDGYPFFLKKVDNEVKITKKDFEFIIRELGLENEVTGRDIL